MDDVIAFIANVIIFGRFEVWIDNDDLKSYLFILQLLVKAVEILSSSEYRDCDGKVLVDMNTWATSSLNPFLISRLK